jgi:hypothetical protein
MYLLDGRGSIPGRGKIFLTSLRRVQTGSGAYPASYLMDTQGIFSPGVKRPGNESDHSPPSSSEVKNGAVITPLPHISSWHSA